VHDAAMAVRFTGVQRSEPEVMRHVARQQRTDCRFLLGAAVDFDQ
jgi:hypothetical protein